MTDMEALLREGRAREMAQAAFYRRLSGLAEEAGDPWLIERLNALLADEQHHISRLTAHLLEAGLRPNATASNPPAPRLEEWEAVARAREADEVAWYESALSDLEPGAVADTLREILASERHHESNLAGKWMAAVRGDPAAGES